MAGPSSLGTNPPAEPKARRTHARRSCDLCRLRKTRCELPDLEVQSSSAPLSKEKSCHRCQVLALPCVVDDTKPRPDRKKKSREVIRSPPTSIPSASSSKKSSRRDLDKSVESMASEGSGFGGVNRQIEDDSEELLHSFTLAMSKETQGELSWNGLNDRIDMTGDLYLSDIDATNVVMPPYGSSQPTESQQSKSMRLHGRPFELVCAMLKVAHGKRGSKKRCIEYKEDFDLDRLINPSLVRKLEAGVLQLQTYHPWLKPLPDLIELHSSQPISISLDLLLSVVIYLASLSLDDKASTVEMRNSLEVNIVSLRDQALLQLPNDIHAAQAMELLIVHAPLGILPLQAINAKPLAIARGQLQAAINITLKPSYSQQIQLAVSSDRMSRGFKDDIVWLRLAVCAAEATLALEDPTSETVKPTSLVVVQNLAEWYTKPERRDLWRVEDGNDDKVIVAKMIGRLSMCDRLLRLSAVHDGLAEIKDALLSSAKDSNFDLLGSIQNTLQNNKERMLALDQRHDEILDMLKASSNGLEAGCVAYRNIRKRFDLNKVNVWALRALMATAFLPGNPLAFSGLPTDMNPSQKVSYALSRAYNPPDLIPLLTDPSSQATKAVWFWGKYRGDICEETLQAVIDISNLVSEPSTKSNQSHASAKRRKVIVPLHEALCLAVESAKILMEMQAGSMVLSNRSKGATSDRCIDPPWGNLLKQTCQATEKIAKSSTSESVKNSPDTVCGECNNLIASMARLAGQWAASARPKAGRPVGRNDEEGRSNTISTGAATLNGYQTQISQVASQQLPESTPFPSEKPDGLGYQPTMPATVLPVPTSQYLQPDGFRIHPLCPYRQSECQSNQPSSNLVDQSLQGAQTHHQSDTWTNWNDPQTFNLNGVIQPSETDLLLSQMFNYSYSVQSSMVMDPPVSRDLTQDALFGFHHHAA